MKIGPGVSELWEVENRRLPLTWRMAYTTAYTSLKCACRLRLPGFKLRELDTWFPAQRCRFRCRFRDRFRTCRSACRCGRVRGSSAAGPGGRPASFPRKKWAKPQASWLRTERKVRKNRTRSYMNGSTATANLRKWRTLFFYVSYGVLTEFLRMNVILTYFCSVQRR